MDTMLPIGSVVELEGFKEYVVIIGLFPAFVEDNKTVVYQYVGCNYLKGYRSVDDYIFFDESKIKNVYYIGYAIEFDFIFLKVLYEIYKQLNSGKDFMMAIDEVCKKAEPNNSEKYNELKKKVYDYYFTDNSNEAKVRQGD